MGVSYLAIDWDDSNCDEYPGGTVLRDAAGNVLRVSLGPNDVDCRPYYQASADDWIVKALVASEDGTFFEHCGVRPLSALRALFQNLTCRRRISGASTITMQAVRLITPHRKSYFEKWVESFRAIKMERRRDKLWILSQYLNRAPYGSNFIGIAAAANGWFGKNAKDLGLGEAAMLAGMVQAPSRFRPDRGYERALKRRDYVLGRMLETGAATAEQIEAAKGVAPVVCRAPRPFKAPYFCDYYLNEVLGRNREGQRRSGDFVTPLNADIQATCEGVVNSAAESGGYSVTAVVMKVATGEVVALAVSGDYFDRDHGQVNTALAPRPAGSTLKPFLAAFAMDLGLATPDERLADVPKTYQGYRPANFDAKWRGRVTLKDALVLSLNIPFVQLAERVGLDRFGAGLRSLGLKHMNEADERFGLGMAIGNVEVTLVELVGAYRELALAASNGKGAGMSREAAYLVSEMLSGDKRSSAALGHVADVKTSRFAWKTGTSAAYRDAWTVAWNPEYVVGVWCGHIIGFGDESVVGAKAAAPQAWRIARSLYPQNDGPWFVEPGGIIRRRTCAATGLAANPDCPETEVTVAIAGRSSPRLCEMHCRDFDGNLLEREDPGIAAFLGRIGTAERLVVSKPEDGAKFRLVDGMSQQKIVCSASGNPEGARLWWFVDGRPVGETTGGGQLAVEMTRGRHVVTCVTCEGVTASASYTVE